MLTSLVALSHDLLFLPVRAGELPRPQLFLSQRDSQLFLPAWLLWESWIVELGFLPCGRP